LVAPEGERRERKGRNTGRRVQNNAKGTNPHHLTPSTDTICRNIGYRKDLMVYGG
jgi:hypothetical protein